MVNAKPIETYYNGYRFRSRLEARWAVFFDTMNIKYDYEVEGYVTKDGIMYLPDFVLHGFHGRGPDGERVTLDLWCEVKGVKNINEMYNYKYDDLKKVQSFSESEPIIILPDVPVSAYAWWETELTNFNTVDGDQWACIICKPPDQDGLVLCGADGESRPTDGQIVQTETALGKARYARFEHGETPSCPNTNIVN